MWLCGICNAQQQASEAGGYPQRPIRMIIPYPPGGSADLLARMIGQRLGGKLKQQVVIDNRAGGGGNIAAETASRANPDGYTLILSLSGLVTTAVVNPHTNYDPVRGFTPILLIARSPYRVVINPTLPARTIQEWFALVKAEPGRINYGTAGAGSAVHLSVELFKLMTRVDIVHVPYKGTGPAMTDLIGGQVHMLITGYPGALPHIKAGRLRALGVTGAKRLVAAPELPAIGETVKGYEVLSSYGLLLPLNTPKAIVARLHKETAATVRRSEVQEKLIALGFEPEGNTPAEFAAQLKNELSKWARVIKIAKVVVE
jgi:tripartite-type tricarboxylate transporter receptor subunit TctC